MEISKYEKNKEYFKEYYKKNKEQIDKQQREYRKINRSRVTKMNNDRRKIVSAELKKQGQIYTYLPKTERQNKMVISLSKKLNISENTARELLEHNNWNYVSIIESEVSNNESI